MKRASIAILVTGLLLAGSAQAQFTADYQTNIISGVVSNWTGNYVVGSNTFRNVLLLQNSSVLSNSSGFVGYETTASNNTAIVSGGSSWGSTGSLFYVGSSGVRNSLIISNAGQVRSVQGFIGGGGGSNSVCVTGMDSLWVNSGSLWIGSSSGSNSLTISNGGKVLSENGYITYFGYLGYLLYNSNNCVIVSGSGSVWSNTARLHVGHAGGRALLLIQDGGQVTCDYGMMSVDWASERNLIRVTGTGSTFSVQSLLTAGSGAAGNELTVSNGGHVINGACWVGATPYSSNNTVVITGAGSLWKIGRELCVGYASENNRARVDGGSVLASNLVVGMATGTCNNVVQLDSGSVVVTNASHNAILEVRRGQFVMNGGLLIVDKLVMTNSCARFNYNGGTVSIPVVQFDPVMDADGDGLANGWEQANGLDPLVATGKDGPDADIDGDGRSNLQEFLAGTSPTNSASMFRVLSAVTETNDVRVSWTAVGGKSYRVQTNAVPGSGFADLSELISVPGSGETVTNYLDVGSATNGPARFYRIRLGP